MSAVLEQRPGLRRRSRDPGSQRLIEELFERVNSVASLPAAALRIIEVTSDPHSEAEDLLLAVEGDPAMAARILRIVNSSYYPLRRSVADLKAAITLLGFREIRNLALTASMSDLFGPGGNHAGYTREGLWSHSTGVAAAAKVIARNTGRANPSEAYLAGLLHDLGFILLDQYLRRPFCNVLDQLTAETPTCEVEQTTLHFDHTELGAYIAGRWSFPDGVSAAIRHHHEPAHCDDDQADMVAIVAMANFLCTLHGLTSLGVRNVPEPPDEVIDRLQLGPDAIRSFKDQFQETLAQATIMAGV